MISFIVIPFFFFSFVLDLNVGAYILCITKTKLSTYVKYIYTEWSETISVQNLKEPKFGSDDAKGFAVQCVSVNATWR